MSNQGETSPTVDQMPALAAEFVQVCKGNGVNLDYLPRTLPLVDKLLNGKRADTAGELKAKYVPWMTAYLGEVIRKETGGSWYDFDGRPMLNVGDYQADPMGIVTGLIETGQGIDGDVSIESTKAYCEMISRMQRVWLEGTVLGTFESMTALRTSMTSDARLAGTIVAQSQQAIKTAKLTFDEPLDFTSESLEGVERIMTKLQKQEPKLTEEQITELSKLWGVYVGEVIRRYYGGQWAMVDGLPDVALGGKHAAPVAKVRKRLVGGATENLKYYFTSIMKVLSSQQSP
jgi:hypothetical protein